MSILFRKESPDLDVATLIASRGFVQPVSAALRTDVDVHLRHGQIVFLVIDAEKEAVVGFALFNDLAPVLYLSGIILDPAYQGRGIAALAVAEARVLTGATHLALRTQSARMWLAGSRMVEEWYPHPKQQIPDHLRPLAEQAAARTNSVFPVAVGLYGGPLYGAKPVHHDETLQSWWDSLCSFERGDAVFCIGRF